MKTVGIVSAAFLIYNKYTLILARWGVMQFDKNKFYFKHFIYNDRTFFSFFKGYSEKDTAYQIKNIDVIDRRFASTNAWPVPHQNHTVHAQSPKIPANDPYDACAPIHALQHSA